MYKNLKHTARAMRNFCIQLEQDINSKAMNEDMLEQYFHELEMGDYSLMSALHEAWHEAEEAKNPTNTGETAQ
jgi:hypothetical protein